MKVAFLYNTSHPSDALVNWVLALQRFTQKHEVELLLRQPHQGRRGIWNMAPPWPDYVWAMTASCYPTREIDTDIAALRSEGVKVGVVHNEDWGLPTPGKYPSFAWTYRAQSNLVAYDAIYCPQPVFPRICEAKQGYPLIHAGTFGHCEPKKGTLALARRMNQLSIPFTVFCPLTLYDRYKDYAETVSRAGATVIVHPWKEKIEELREYFDRAEISHFLFFLTPSKGGTGGSATGPRYATMFGRPVVVIDDEPEGVGPRELNVVPSPGTLQKVHFEEAILANCRWTPDRYIDSLIWHTDQYYKGKEV